MGERVFLAGAGGVVGRRLSPLLRDAGYAVYGSTRKPDVAASLKAVGIAPVVVDVFDAPALSAALADIRPAVVIHQLTDLSLGFDPDRVDETLRRNARIRTEGTRHLVAAAAAAGARRLIAQSIAWVYAPGPLPHREDDPLDKDSEGTRRMTVEGVAALEELTLGAPLDGIVLRYGRLYGGGAGVERPSDADSPWVHVDAAAHAALLAAGRGGRGIYNIADPGPYASSEKAQRAFGWDPGYRSGSK
jgi:nucleoside-diphosphate-sugar epimerase